MRITLLFSALLMFSAAWAQRLPDGGVLFQDAKDPAELSADRDPGVVRYRYVTVNLGLFSGDRGKLGAHLEQGALVDLNLFEDVLLTGVLDRVESNSDGSITWVGFLAEFDHSSVTIVVTKDGIVSGNIVMPGAFYQIRYVGNGVHAIRLLDQSALPPEAEPEIVQEETHHKDLPVPLKAGDDGSVIDVMVVYTPAARSGAGGTSAMQSLINLAVSETNQSYTNSGVNFQLNLVHSAEVTYTESSSFSTDLSRLRGTSDGYMDNVHSLRDQYCADAVALIVNTSQYCGIAGLMTTVSTSFESEAFSVTARVCATGYYSFGHELGHNMGARHDWYVDGSTSPYIYNHGYTYPSAGWRTIMAYNNACSAAGTSCTRIQYWSNPNVTYGGQAMGVGGSTVGSSAYNALALNNSAITVANFRDSTSVSCGGSTGGGGCSGFSYTGNGTLSGAGDYDFHPNGTYYQSTSSGTHSATLTGPNSTDFDLYLWKWNGSAWATVASSTGSTSSESITYSGTSGYYVWRVESYSGSGDYTLCADWP